jgi:hypothetical protein
MPSILDALFEEKYSSQLLMQEQKIGLLREQLRNAEEEYQSIRIGQCMYRSAKEGGEFARALLYGLEFCRN